MTVIIHFQKRSFKNQNFRVNGFWRNISLIYKHANDERIHKRQVSLDGCDLSWIWWNILVNCNGWPSLTRRGLYRLLKFYIIPLPIMFFAKSVSFIKRMLIAIRDECNNYIWIDLGGPNVKNKKLETFNINWRWVILPYH